jgi:leucyl/phenylalanyl-tRNA--protein transferase
MWVEEAGSNLWYSPDPRAIFPLDSFHIPRRFRRRLKQLPFELRIDTQFTQVMQGCSQRKDTWISEEFVYVYSQLHSLGFAHSVEAWLEGNLVGGLYGVSLQGAFFGESMFSLVSDASKFCLVHLVRRLREKGFTLLDTQWLTPHLASFGAIEIPRKEYLARLELALEIDAEF